MSEPGIHTAPGAAAQGRRLALVVAVTDYVDSSLRRLRAPAGDAAELRDLLADPEIGAFSVTSVINERAQQIRLAIEDFLSDRRTEDVLLVYLSCHGLMDARRRLYFAARDTIKNRLASSGVEASWVLDQLEDCRARRQVVILDCCFSGAFGQRSKGDDDLGLGERLVGDGRGRVVLTASRGSEYSFEGEPLQGEVDPRGSVFTGALIEGIRSGRADTDGDGRVSVDEAYAYAFERVRASGSQQTPQRWLYGAEGSILLARVPSDEPRPDQPPPAVVATGSDGTAAEPAASAATRRPSRRPRGRTMVVGLAAALVLVAAGVVGAVVLHDGRGSPDRGVHPGHDPLTGTITGSAPWRLLINDATSAAGGSDVGCDVTLTKSGEAPITWRSIYQPPAAFQMHESGTFTYKRSSAGCLLTYLDGTGNAEIPYAWERTGGDTNAFQSPGTLSVAVADFNGSTSCELSLWSVEGLLLDRQIATTTHDTVTLDSNGPAEVYLAAPQCTVNIKKGS